MIELYDSEEAFAIHNKNNRANMDKELIACIAGAPKVLITGYRGSHPTLCLATQVIQTALVGPPGIKDGTPSLGVPQCPHGFLSRRHVLHATVCLMGVCAGVVATIPVAKNGEGCNPHPSTTQPDRNCNHDCKRNLITNPDANPNPNPNPTIILNTDLTQSPILILTQTLTDPT